MLLEFVFTVVLLVGFALFEFVTELVVVVLVTEVVSLIIVVFFLLLAFSNVLTLAVAEVLFLTVVAKVFIRQDRAVRALLVGAALLTTAAVNFVNNYVCLVLLVLKLTCKTRLPNVYPFKDCIATTASS